MGNPGGPKKPHVVSRGSKPAHRETRTTEIDTRALAQLIEQPLPPPMPTRAPTDEPDLEIVADDKSAKLRAASGRAHTMRRGESPPKIAEGSGAMPPTPPKGTPLVARPPSPQQLVAT